MDKKVLIQNKDFKSLGWGNHATRYGWDVHYLDKSPMFFVLELIKLCFNRNKPNVICFRYLNDYKSLLKTCARLLSESASILVSFMLGIKVAWICHNVDKETIQHHPTLSKFRRWLISKASSVIFVTDPLLVNHAEEHLSVKDGKRIAPLCFGKALNSESKIGATLLNEFTNLKLFYSEAKRNSNAVGLWIGNPSDKGINGLDFIAKSARLKKSKVRFIVIGPISEFLLNKNREDILHSFQESENVLFCDFSFDIPPRLWPDICDFVFKQLDDLSIPFTYYNAIYNKLSILTFSGTFGGQFVSHYNVGLCVDEQKPLSLNEQIINNDWKFDDFIETHNWEAGAKSLFDALDKIVSP